MSRSVSALHRSRWAALGAAVAVVLGSASLFPASARIDGESRAAFVPITACRLMDTRDGPDNIGPRVGPLGPQETLDVVVVGANGNCNIPSDAVGVAMNVTAILPTTSSFLTVFPSDESRPMAANLNWVGGQPAVSNAVTTALSADGRVSFYNLKGSVDLAVDIVGYLVDSAPEVLGRTIQIRATTDDVANGVALIAALDQAATLAPSDVSPVVVHLEPGTYTTSSPVVLGAGVSLVGSGASNTVVSATSASPAAQLVVSGPSALEDIAVVRTMPGHLIRVQSGRLVIEDSTITINGSYSGVALQQGATVEVSGSTLGYSGADTDIGLLVDGSFSSSILIEDSTLTTSYKAIDVPMRATATVRNSRLLSPSPSGTGIVSGSGTLNISGSYVDGTVAVGTEVCRGIATALTFLNVTCP